MKNDVIENVFDEAMRIFEGSIEWLTATPPELELEVVQDDFVSPLARTSDTLPLRCVSLRVFSEVRGKLTSEYGQVAIDTRTRMICHDRTTPGLLRPKFRGLGDLSKLLVLTPLFVQSRSQLLEERRKQARNEELAGISRQAARLLDALRGKLDTETEALLTEALRREWVLHLSRKKELTHTDAKHVLQLCEFVECTPLTCRHGEFSQGAVDQEILDRFQSIFHWFDFNGSCLANGYQRHGHPPVIHVFRTEFSVKRGMVRDYDVHDLLRPVRTRTNHSRSNNAPPPAA